MYLPKKIDFSMNGKRKHLYLWSLFDLVCVGLHSSPVKFLYLRILPLIAGCAVELLLLLLLVPGEVNTGLPYKWGGFDDPASFDVAIANGLAGGGCFIARKTPGRQRGGEQTRCRSRLFRFRVALPETAIRP